MWWCTRLCRVTISGFLWRLLRASWIDYFRIYVRTTSCFLVLLCQVLEDHFGLLGKTTSGFMLSRMTILVSFEGLCVDSWKGYYIISVKTTKGLGWPFQVSLEDHFRLLQDFCEDHLRSSGMTISGFLGKPLQRNDFSRMSVKTTCGFVTNWSFLCRSLWGNSKTCSGFLWRPHHALWKEHF